MLVPREIIRRKKKDKKTNGNSNSIYNKSTREKEMAHMQNAHCGA